VGSSQAQVPGMREAAAAAGFCEQSAADWTMANVGEGSRCELQAPAVTSGGAGDRVCFTVWKRR
jgi:hypothetical protein